MIPSTVVANAARNSIRRCVASRAASARNSLLLTKRAVSRREARLPAIARERRAKYSTRALANYHEAPLSELRGLDYETGRDDNECVVNIYLDTEQSKIEERMNFIKFLEELTRSGGIDEDVRRRIEVFLDGKRYEAIAAAQI